LFDYFGREVTFFSLGSIAALGAALVFLLMRETRPSVGPTVAAWPIKAPAPSA